MTQATYQYVSEMVYAAKRTPGRPRTKSGNADRWSTLDVVGEALRWAGGYHLTHFASRGLQPQAPLFVAGMTDDEEILAWHDSLAAVALAPKEKRPRMMTARGQEAQRENSPVLLSLVASYPESGLLSEEDLMRLELSERERYMRELIARRREEVLPSKRFITWRDTTLEWARERYGADRMRIAVVHYDESHIHMHVLFDDGGRTVKPISLHAGEQALGKGASGSVKRAEYSRRGVAMQDSYHQDVAGPLGIGRISLTPHGRLSAAERKAARARARAKEDADAVLRRADEDARRLREAAEREVEATRRTELERARRYVDAAYAKAETDLARQREEQLAQLDRELQALREAEKARVVTEVRELMGEALTRLHAREATWERLLEQAVPDADERARMMAAVGLVEAPRAGAGAGR